MTVLRSSAILIGSVFLCLLSSCNPKAPEPPAPVNPGPGNELAAAIGGDELMEVSGLATSWKEDDLFWMINDSGNGARIYAVKTPSGEFQELKVKRAKNKDWEDLSSFQYNNQPYLLVSDTGDNRARRKTARLYLIPEPLVDFEKPRQTEKVWPEHVYNFKYEGGPTDCEAMSFDPVSQSVLFLSKRTVPPVLYSLPLSEKSDDILTAEKLGEATGLPRPDPSLKNLLPDSWKYSAQPTAIDISSNGRFMVVLTYFNAYLFEREQNISWIQALQGKPRVLKTPLLPQAESVCFGPQTKNVFIISEKRQDLFRIAL